jgi:thiol-disulfide isomerase/thioredoxin
MRAAAALLAGLILLGPMTGAAQEALKPWPGGPTPALKLKDLDGREHALDAYRGKVVLVNFWATWCEPCKEEMPSIERLRRSLEGRPFAVLAVNLAEPDARVQAFLRQVPLGFPVLMDRDAAAAKAWKARMLPATFIVGADGRVRYSYIGELDWSREPVSKQITALLPR